MCSSTVARLGADSKTWSLLFDPLRYVGLPGFGAVIFRRTYRQITMEGGLWDESEKLYPFVAGRPRRGLLDWTFPSGAKVSFANLEHEQDRLNYQGAQIAYIGFDELTHFSETMFWYLLSRNRSTCGAPPCIRATCNPDPDSFLARLVAWWIDDETGLAIPERAGVVRWFVRPGDEVVFDDDRIALQERFPKLVPLSFSFVPARVDDNRELLRRDPGYRARLLAMGYVERAQLLDGNWKVRPAAGKVFNRASFGMVPIAPPGGVEVRFFDFAATEKKRKGDDPDRTAGVKIRRVAGRYYVVDCVAETFGPADVDRLVLNTCVQDALVARREGVVYAVRWEEEPGSAGKRESARLVAMLVEAFAVHGLSVDAAGVRSTGDKGTRANSLASTAGVGGVWLVAQAWNEPYLAELHAFPDGAHDDRVDASAGAFNAVTELDAAGGASVVNEPEVVDEGGTRGW